METDRGQSPQRDFVAGPAVVGELRSIIVESKTETGLSPRKKLFLAAALLLAVSATLFAGLFHTASVASGDFKSGVTQCPGMKPSR